MKVWESLTIADVDARLLHLEQPLQALDQVMWFPGPRVDELHRQDRRPPVHPGYTDAVVATRAEDSRHVGAVTAEPSLSSIGSQADRRRRCCMPWVPPDSRRPRPGWSRRSRPGPDGCSRRRCRPRRSPRAGAPVVTSQAGMMCSSAPAAPRAVDRLPGVLERPLLVEAGSSGTAEASMTKSGSAKRTPPCARTRRTVAELASGGHM